MSRTIPSGLATHYADDLQTLAWGARIERADGEVFGWTTSDRDATIAGDTYSSAPGMSVAGLVSTAGLAVDNTEVTLLADDVTVTRTDMLSGIWNGARFELFVYNWKSPSAGRDIHKAGTLGQWRAKAGAWVAELRGPQQALQQTIAEPSTQTCRYRLGSTAMPEGLCRVDLGPFTVTGTLTAVTSNQTFTDSGRSEGDDWFAEGVLTWTSGLNDGLSAKVKTYASDTFTLSIPMLFEVQVGDTYSVYAGCRKRLEDCKTKFSNVLNFGGEPHRPTPDDLTKGPTPNAD